MRVKLSDLRPEGYVAAFDLSNGWTVSVRQGWGDQVSVMAWPTGTDTGVPAYNFGGRGDHLTELTDHDVPDLFAEVAGLPRP